MTDTSRQSGSSTTTTKGNTAFISYMQIIGIILVVLGHSFHEYPDGHNGSSLLIYRMIYNFHMPLFLFVSGFLLHYTTFGRGENFPKPPAYTAKKAKRLLVPYIVLTLVTYVPRAALSGLADKPMELSVSGLTQSLFLPSHLPIPYFWYLQVSFLLLVAIYLIYYLSHRIAINRVWILATLFAVFLLVKYIDVPTTETFSIRTMMQLGIYFVLGVAYSEFYGRINKFLPLDTCLALVLTCAIWLCLFMIGERTWLYDVATVFGIAMCICGAKLIAKHGIRLFDHLSGANYIIFLLSWYFNVICQQVLGRYVDLPWWLHTVMSLIFGIYIPWLFYIIMKRHSRHRPVRILSAILGQKF